MQLLRFKFLEHLARAKKKRSDLVEFFAQRLMVVVHVSTHSSLVTLSIKILHRIANAS